MTQFKFGDRITRKSSRNADEGIVRSVTPTHVDVFWLDSKWRSTIRQDRIKLVKAAEEPKTYPDLESAQEAMDRGETVRIEMEPLVIDPALLRLARHFQDKERLEEWRESQRIEGESR